MENPNGTGRILSLMSTDTDYCLDLYDFTGPVVQMYECNGGNNQNWTVNSDGTITSDGLCLTADSNSDAPLEVWAGPLSDGSVATLLFNRGFVVKIFSLFTSVGLWHIQ